MRATDFQLPVNVSCLAPKPAEMSLITLRGRCSYYTSRVRNNSSSFSPLLLPGKTHFQRGARCPPQPCHPRYFQNMSRYSPVQKEASAFLYISQIWLYLIGKRTNRSLFSASRGSVISVGKGQICMNNIEIAYLSRVSKISVSRKKTCHRWKLSPAALSWLSLADMVAIQ